MKMRRVMTIKAHRYGTRHLTAGEEYEVPARHALALLAGKKVRYAPHKQHAPTAVSPRPPGEPPAAPVRDSPTPEPAAEIENLRTQANELGIEVDRRWGLVRLQHEIHQARR
jgi:hypothetical protein